MIQHLNQPRQEAISNFFAKHGKAQIT